MWWKQTLLDGAAKVPGIISWPAVIPAGQQIDHVAGLVDVNATIVDAVNGPELPRSVGRSMLGMLTGTAEWDDLTISEYCADDNQPCGGIRGVDRPHYSRMVRTARYKLIDHGDEPAQLCDLIDDPDETVNLADSPDHQEVLTELQSVARDGWDPEELCIETQTSLAEQRVINEWARETEPTVRHRWQMNPEYNALYDPMLDITPDPAA